MTKDEFNKLFKLIVEEVQETRNEGQKEYAHEEDNIFANFERVGASLNISKEQTLMVYLMKHIDGINAWIKGHKSQREDVRGRIKDAIVYLSLLWAMAETEKVSKNDIDIFFDEVERFGCTKSKTSNGSIFNPITGEVTQQSIGDEAV